ncbi:hypothetical protein SAMN05192574_105357 [Mucilaginibacter gossypiicola]|uniref:Uncharacterized protein n=2 Tax=Mucilaginibacter gossypiicola TaxID=551995 RepID=A0A1H8M264_9SPHI|nr:hypothetical protein SAMN05192574_105357 [Mucilaginibacter gossypiicola]
MAIAGFIWLIISHVNKSKQRILATFIVTEAYINDQDVTERYLANNAYFVFYRTGSDPIAFGGIMGDTGTQTYGGISYIIAKRLIQTSSKEPSDTQSFTWTYENAHDGGRSRANVTLMKTYTVNKVGFDLLIVTEEHHRLTFKGYMADTIRTIRS